MVGEDMNERHTEDMFENAMKEALVSPNVLEVIAARLNVLQDQNRIVSG